MPPKERNKAFDILKGIGIAAVVLGHTGTGFNPFIYLFHIPLFFFASGYFFKDTYLSNTWSFLWRRIKGLYFPYVGAGLVALVLHNWFVSIHIYSPLANVPVGYLTHPQLWRAALDTVLFKHTELLLAPFWFLTVLFTATILFFLIRLIATKLPGNDQTTTFLLVVMVFCLGIKLLLNDTNSPWLFPISCIATGCYALGYWAARFKDILLVTWQGALACFLILIASLPFSAQLDLHVGSINSPGYFLLGAVSGIYFCLYFATLFAKWKVTERIGTTVGQASLFILTLHVLSFKAFALIEIHAWNMSINRLGDFAIPVGSHYPWIFFYSIVGVAIPTLIYVGYGKVKQVLPARQAHS